MQKYRYDINGRFNTQPPEGGWVMSVCVFRVFLCFNTQPPEGGWHPTCRSLIYHNLFQHTAARRRLAPYELR